MIVVILLVLILGLIVGFQLNNNGSGYFIRNFFDQLKCKRIFRKMKVGEIYASYNIEAVDDLTVENYYKLYFIKEKSTYNIRVEVIDELKDAYIGIILPASEVGKDIINYKRVGNFKLYKGSNPKIKKYAFNEQLFSTMKNEEKSDG